ncbi:MAG: DUF2663 family protein [Tuberibacillus sp.]
MNEKEFNLNELSPVTLKVINRLKDWKKRRELWKKIKFIFDILALVLMFAIIWKVNAELGRAENLSQFYSVLFSRGVENALVILIPTLIVWKFAHMKYREVDDDYEVLRKEVIDRADELWFHFPEDWSNRQEALKYIDKEFGVNLFYKKK